MQEYSPVIPNQKQESPQHKCITDKEDVDDIDSMNLDLSLGRWDDYRRFKLFDNIFVGDKYSLKSHIHTTCLATQSSLEKLHSITEVTNHWNGPISLAVFAAYEEELNSLLTYILYLRKCYIKVKENVSFHLGLAMERRPKHILIDMEQVEDLDCESPTSIFQGLIKVLNRGMNFWRNKFPYPQNHMRNLARKNCQTKYVFLTDIDIIPSNGMAEEIDDFIRRENCANKCSYVVPTYELDVRVSFPTNKSDLIRLTKKGLARPFHQKVFVYNQYATNFSRLVFLFNSFLYC